MESRAVFQAKNQAKLFLLNFHPVHGARLLEPVRDVFHDDERERIGLDGLVRGHISAVTVVDLQN